MKQVGLGIIVAAGLTLPAFGQGVDPFIGTWKMNLEKTTIIGAPVPKSYIMVITGDGQNLSGTVDVVGVPEGGASTLKFMWICDGQLHPATGSRDFDSTACIRFGNTINQVFYKDGKPVSAGQSRINSNGAYTYTSEGMYANGRPFSRSYVFDRQ